MTMIVTVLVGAGILILASGLDGSSLKDTFNKLITNQPIAWTGSGNVPSVPGTPTIPSNSPSTTVTPGKNKSCPTGYVYDPVRGVCELSTKQGGA
jgi:hypothetical protein